MVVLQTKLRSFVREKNCDRFDYQPRTLPEDGRIQITTTGRLAEKKGIEYVIRAIAQLISIYPRLHYKIIGEGELRPYFTKLIEELNLTKNVELMGWRNERNCGGFEKYSYLCCP